MGSDEEKCVGFVHPCIYFDNNGTTFATRGVEQAMCRALRLGNASADYAKEGRDLIKRFKRKVLNRVSNPRAEVIITSGASEAINLFLRSMADCKPKSNFVVSAVEHGTVLECARDLANKGRISLTEVGVRSDGCVHLEDVKKVVRQDTSVVAVMHINNETGSINDIKGIQRFCRRRGIKYLADTVQSFGKYKLPDLDACTVSFHKLYGPPGIGCLIVDRGILNGRGFTAQISGSQNGGYRGGTENLPGIAGSLKTMELTFKRRSEKNRHLEKMKSRILENIGREFDEMDFREYVGKSEHFRGFSRDWSFTQVGGYGPDGVGEGAPNTLLLSFCKSKSDPHHFCNVELKHELAKNNVIVSIGSACHTKSKGPSHVLKAMKAPFIVRCGVVRVSLGDFNTMDECDRFSRILIDCIRKQE